MQQPAESRKTALATGVRRYIGRPCKACGGVERYALRGRCIACLNRRTNARRAAQRRDGCPKYYERNRAKAARHDARRRGYCSPVYARGALHEAFGPCAICGGKGNCLDHDHATGAVRATLCGRCNRDRVGHAESISPATIRYLARHGSDALTKLLAAIVEAQTIVALEDANADL